MPPREDRSAPQRPTLPPTQVAPEPGNHIPLQPEPPRGQRYYVPAFEQGSETQNPYARTHRSEELTPTKVMMTPDWMRQQPPPQMFQAPRLAQAKPAGFFRRSGYWDTFLLTIVPFLLLALFTQSKIVLLLAPLFGLIAMGIRFFIKKSRAPSPPAAPVYAASAPMPGYQQMPEARKMRPPILPFAIAGAFIFFLVGAVTTKQFGESLFSALVGLAIGLAVWSVRVAVQKSKKPRQ